MMAASFKNVEEANQVAVYVGMGIGK